MLDGRSLTTISSPVHVRPLPKSKPSRAFWQLTRTERATCRADPLLFGRTRVRYSGFAVSFNLPMAMPIDIAIGVPSLLDPATRREMTDASQRLAHIRAFLMDEGLAPRP